MFEAEFDPSESDAPTHGTAGVFSSWNLARFDNVLIGAPITGVGGTYVDFSPGTSAWFPEQRGTWTVEN